MGEVRGFIQMPGKEIRARVAGKAAGSGVIRLADARARLPGLPAE